MNYRGLWADLAMCRLRNNLVTFGAKVNRFLVRGRENRDVYDEFCHGEEGDFPQSSVRRYAGSRAALPGMA